MKAKPRATAKKPLEIKDENVRLKIYSGTNRVNGTAYPQFTLVYYDGDQRRKKRFASLAAAKKEAKFVARNLSKGEFQILQLTGADRTIYVQAVKQLKPLNIPLNVAVLEYVSAVKRLPKGATLKEAVDLLKKRSPEAMERKTVRQVADDLIKAKRAAKFSEVHLRDLESRLKRIGNDFKMNITGVSSTMIQTWLNEMKGAGRTKLNYLRVISALFRFAIKRKLLPKDAMEEIEAVQPAKLDVEDIEIFTPGEMSEILAAARPEMIPWLAIAGFAGLRSAELQRLDWSEVNLDERHIEIKASKAKTGARRHAPITDNLDQWLAPHVKTSGKVTGFESWWNQMPKVVEAVNARRRQAAEQAGNIFLEKNKFIWKHNALRHSFCSYRMAVIKDAPQVAFEAGNSPRVIFKHYRTLVSETEGNKWFDIEPSGKT